MQTAHGAGLDPLSYVWYSSIGDLENYHKQTSTLKVDAPADGTVVVVVRDAQGGVNWMTRPSASSSA